MPDENLVLGFDTSAAHCAAALLSGDRVLAEAREEMARGQAERLMVLLEEVLATGDARWRDLDRIGVGIGPGNFTGIRISVAAARGLALGLGIPAIGISTLDALAFGAGPPVVTSVDAKAGRLYLKTDDGDPILADRSALPRLPAGARCIGDAAEALAAACGGQANAPAYPLAGAIARLAARAAPRAGARPTPLYLRPPDAAPVRQVLPVR